MRNVLRADTDPPVWVTSATPASSPRRRFLLLLDRLASYSLLFQASTHRSQASADAQVGLYSLFSSYNFL